MNAKLLLGTAFALVAVPAFANEPGIGIVGGDTNGITVKIPTGEHSQVDLAAGIDLNIASDDLNPSDGRFRADWSRSLYTISSNNVDLPIYLGAGGFFELNDADFGLRAPLGIALEFNTVPLELFAQTGLEVYLLDNGTNDNNVGLNGAVGMRIQTR